MNRNQPKHYVPIKKFSLKYQYYMYLDTDEHYADQIFIDNKLYVDFLGTYSSDTSKYRFVRCRVLKKDRETFIHCIDQLVYKMKLVGNNDYEDFVTEIVGAMYNS